MLLGNILYVEDEDNIRLFCKVFLSRQGYNVTAVSNGIDGLREISSRAFDLLITDNEMPGLSGIELIKKARAMHPQLPIILASGSANEHYESLNPSLHFTALQKPFGSHELLYAIQQLPIPR